MLANLTELVYVDLSNNFFTGLIPIFYMSKKLTSIDLSSNNLTGSLSSTHFEGLSNIVRINLVENSLTGSIPQSLFSLPSLDILALSYNQFNGTFRLKNIHNLKNLTQLALSYNRLSVDVGRDDSSLSAFSKITSLDLASCNVYNFPDFIKHSYLRFLDLSNNQIAGEIPNWIWKIGNGTLLTLNLSHNHLVGLQKPYHFPSFLSDFDLYSNQLRGEFPLPPYHAYYVDYSNNNFDNLNPLNMENFNSTFSFFSIANNSLTGPIPAFLCNSTYLEVLDLSLNNLSGHIPPCLLENLNDLLVLKLWSNNISGDIPDKVSARCGLKAVDLSNNNIGGSIPKSLANCKSLEVMNVGNNNINDSFPCMLPSSLRVLLLRSNRFHGEVRCHESWPNLQIIDIASNSCNGYLRQKTFSSWRGMMVDSDAQWRSTNLGYNVIRPSFYYFIDVALTFKGRKLNVAKISGNLASIDFCCNNFQGEIPDALGDLSSLYLLNLSHNSLIGTIPKSLGNLRQLGSLDLSVNQLRGMIPVELTGLTFLSVLNLSYNNLVGMIPTGRQFQTFSADLFKGNAGLCGFPLSTSCRNSDEDELSPSSEPHQEEEIEWGYVSAALGYILGLGSILWILLWCNSLRQKYFEKVNEILENIFDRLDRKRRQGRRRRVDRNDQVMRRQ